MIMWNQIYEAIVNINGKLSKFCIHIITLLPYRV